jgi:excisionase family DNA binding protein
MSVGPVDPARPEAEGEGSREPQVPDELLTPAEVAAMFRVNPKTVTRWNRSGKLSAIRTLGGHRRFRAAEVRRLLAEGADRTDAGP